MLTISVEMVKIIITPFSHPSWRLAHPCSGHFRPPCVLANPVNSSKKDLLAMWSVVRPRRPHFSHQYAQTPSSLSACVEKPMNGREADGRTQETDPFETEQNAPLARGSLEEATVPAGFKGRPFKPVRWWWDPPAKPGRLCKADFALRGPAAASHEGGRGGRLGGEGIGPRVTAKRRMGPVGTAVGDQPYGLQSVMRALTRRCVPGICMVCLTPDQQWFAPPDAPRTPGLLPPLFLPLCS